MAQCTDIGLVAPPCIRGLLVDDDPLYLRTLQRSLARRGYDCLTAAGLAEALALSPQREIDFALIDLKLGAHSGLDLIGPLRQAHPRARIILITGYASIATAVEAIKRGADNYLLKPTTVGGIIKALSDAPEVQAEPEATMTPLSRLEWEHIHQALAESNGNVSAAARLLGMHRRSLQRKLAKRPGPERRGQERGD
ncbi:MAG TPA: response regulator [Steroidobacteraceae bacterium]|nr:response regulator [Steroidobacteraceae bacterium]